MKNSQPQLSSIRPPPENLSTPSSMKPHSDHRHSLISRRFRDALFSAAASKYATNDSAHYLSFQSQQFKSIVDCRLHENFPSFHTPTHLPYASMIQRAIAEVGEEDGLSEDSISEFIVKEYEDLPWAHSAFLRRHLGKLCESGELVKSKCGRYNFKVEAGVKRKKRRRKSAGRSRRCREVECADHIEENFDRKKRSKKLMIKGPCAEEVVTSKGTGEQSDSLREVSVGAEGGDHAQGGQLVLNELEEIREHEMNGKQPGPKIKFKYGRKDFDRKRQSQNLVIIGLQAPVSIKEIERQSGSLRKEVHEAKEGDHAKGGQIQMPAEVHADVMIEQPCKKEARSRDGVQYFDDKMQSENVAAANLGALGPTMRGTEEKCVSSKKGIGGAKGRGSSQDREVIMIYKFKEVRNVGMINDHHEVEVQSKDGVEDFGGRNQSQDLMVVGLHAKKAPTTKGTQDQCSSLKKIVDGAEGSRAQAGQTEALGKFKVQEVEIIDQHHEDERQGEMVEEPKEGASIGSNEERGPGEDGTLEFFDAMLNYSNAEENGEIDDAQDCQKLQEENLEFFDAKSDHGYDGANEIIGAQYSKRKVVDEVNKKQNKLEEQQPSKVSDAHTGISKCLETEDPQLSKEHPQLRWPSEIIGSLSSEQEMPNTSEAHKNENSEALLLADIICSPSPGGRRGRPRKLKVQETLATSLSSSAQCCHQRYLESNVENRETSGPDMGNGTHHNDQQPLNLPRGRGRGRGRVRSQVVRENQISVSETFSPSNHLHRQQSAGKRRGRPPKTKI